MENSERDFCIILKRNFYEDIIFRKLFSEKMMNYINKYNNLFLDVTGNFSLNINENNILILIRFNHSNTYFSKIFVNRKITVILLSDNLNCMTYIKFI
jgi:uncharacterized circularly permuted ATP-grasp superfamily protein